MINPLKEVEVNRFILRHPKVDDDLSGFVVAQITDIHLGRWVKPRHLLQLVEYVNDEAPDLVALTGDYVGYSKNDLAPCIRTLGHLEGKVFAVLGNHDHWASTELTHEAFEEAGIPVLTNEVVTVEHNGLCIDVVGVDDEVTKHADVPGAFERCDRRRFCLTLNHVPSIAWDCADHGADLILSGHTHGFQFNIPRLTHHLAERLGTRLFAGPYRLDEAMLYISRGLGSASWPWRIRAKPELSFFTLKPGPMPELEFQSGKVINVEHRRRATSKQGR